MKRKNILKLLIGLLIVLFYIFGRKKESIQLYYEMCDKYPNEFITNLKYNENLSFNDITQEMKNLSLSIGGKWSNKNSNNNYKVAIIVPYRARLRNLKTFIRYMHIYLTNQSIVNYGIYIVEPFKNLTFNRALLINIGFVEALKDDNYDCFIFHDVDMLPENSLNIYECNKNYPKQFAIAISIYNYSSIDYFRNRYLGGVTAFTKDQFKKINGYSNMFFGWGGEDDDAYMRCMKVFKNISRLTPEVGRYFANCHRKEEENSKRLNLLDNSETRMDIDGLNSLKYSVLKTYKISIFTLFHVYYLEE